MTKRSNVRNSTILHSHLLFGVWSAVALIATSCTVGPDYQPPTEAFPKSWNAAETEAASSPMSRTVAEPASLSRYWSLLGDSTLDLLIDRAVEQNLDVQSAGLRIDQARSARIIAAAGLEPTVDASGGATRSRAPGGRTTNSLRAGFDAAWEIDVFGGTRRSIEAADADIQSAQEDRRDVLVSLTGEIAATYFELRAAQQQLRIARENVRAQQQTLGVTRQKFDAGFVSRLDAVNAEAQVVSTQARIPSLESTVAQNIYALDVLLGYSPGTLMGELRPEGDLAALPPVVPIGLPSDLLRRRPDIRRAEADLRAATARIGVATADLYPRFSLSAALGLQGTDAGSFASIANRFWSVGGAIQWPAYRAGAIRANIEVQESVARQTLVAFQATILGALQETEGALVTFRNEQTRYQTLTDSARLSRDALRLASDLYDAGQTDFLNVLTAQRAVLDAESSLLDSRRELLTTLVGLYKALGGGWDPEEPTRESEHPRQNGRE